MFEFISTIAGRILSKSKKIDYEIIFTEENPISDRVSQKKIFIVGGRKYAKWIYMKCPCGCNELLTLSLMKKYNPSWRLKVDKFNRATLYPSIWKKDGCKSHFWLKKGKLIWAKEY